MKKLIAFTLAVVICLSTFSFIKMNYDKKNEDYVQGLNYTGTQKTFNSYYIMNKILTGQDNNILVMGSSELLRINEKSFPSEVFNNGNSTFNFTLYGKGHYQSLVHTIALGAMDKDIKNNKVVLIVSPQWFTEAGAKDSFKSVFSESLMEEFIKNENIPPELKSGVIARAKELLGDNEELVDTLNKHEKVKDDNSLESYIVKTELSVKDKLFELKDEKEFVDSIKSVNRSGQQVDADKIDFKKLMEEAEQQGKENSTNNQFYVFDDYFNTYIKKNMETYKNSAKKGYYENSPEFSDLQLFIDLSKALNKDVMIVSVPMNGYWYDYTGYDKNQRNAYYERIRTIASENKINLADFSGKEYEKYFLRDIMHMGWKGWVYLDEAVYKFAKSNE